nr:MAG TPA: hypothetical protein [Caudoviricetes sp.]
MLIFIFLLIFKRIVVPLHCKRVLRTFARATPTRA